MTRDGSGAAASPRASRRIDPAELEALGRYHLMTSLVVPRPIGWLSTWGADGVGNLAPFSYFGAVSISPMLVSVSIGNRRGGPKDTLVNIRERGSFCANIVTEELLEPMNESSASVAPEVDEFELCGLTKATSDRVDAPFVAEARAVFECEVFKEVDLEGAPNALIIARVVGIRVDQELPFEEGTLLIPPEELHPVGRLGGPVYQLQSGFRRLLRPDLR